MTMEEIIATHDQLEKDLRIAVSTMERKSTIFNIKSKLLELQQQCPHFSDKYNFVQVDEHCPYCGKVIFSPREDRRNF